MAASRESEDDVRPKTRPAGALTAITQAVRRRKVAATAGALAALATVAAVAAFAAGNSPAAPDRDAGAVGSVRAEDAARTLGGAQWTWPPAGRPTTLPDRPLADEQGLEAATERYRVLGRVLLSVPGWAVSEATLPEPYLTVLARCARNWGGVPVGGVASGNNIGPHFPSDGLPIRFDEKKFGRPAEAPRVMDGLIARLEACDAESWRTRPIGQTGAVLAFTDTDVLWIQHKNAHVAVLHVLTTDGPPPPAVQIEVADQVDSWMR